MKRGLLHTITAWLMLVCFGVASTLLSGVVVICRDGHGASRIEWGCGQNQSEECQTSCGSGTADDPGAPHPCQDTRAANDREITKAPSRASLDEIVSFPPSGAEFFRWDDAPTPPRPLRAACQPRPPDPLGHIRTVVFLV